MASPNIYSSSPARLQRRVSIKETAEALLGSTVGADFDPFHSSICAIDLVMVAGAPWLAEGLERDFFKDESGYRKIGGGANTPDVAYFFRSTPNLLHYLKRQSFYVPRGAEPLPQVGMACFFDWEDRGRFNFAPDRSGIVVDVKDEHISRVILARRNASHETPGFVVSELHLTPGDPFERALIGYSDLP